MSCICKFLNEKEHDKVDVFRMISGFKIWCTHMKEFHVFDEKSVKFGVQKMLNVS